MLNSGTFLGPSKLMLTYIDAMLEELQHRWHCRRLHGTDQAIHNFLVYTGKFIGTGMLTCGWVLELQCSFTRGRSQSQLQLVSFVCWSCVQLLGSDCYHILSDSIDQYRKGQSCCLTQMREPV